MLRSLFCWTLIVELVSSLPFVTQWRTSSLGESIRLPLTVTPTGGLNIDWGDVTQVNVTTLPVTHSYPTAGVYNVSITGNIVGFRFANGGDAAKLINIVSWGDSFFMDANSVDVFRGCVNLQVSAPAATQPVFLPGATLQGMFKNSSFNSPLNWDLANVTSLISMFEDAVNFNQPFTFSNTQAVNNTAYMFRNATVFNQLVTLDTVNVVDMSGMFQWARAFNQPVNFNTGNVKNIYSMFSGAYVFNRAIHFNASSLVQAEFVFTNALNFNSVVNFSSSLALKSVRALFYAAPKYNLPIIFQTDNVENMASMFQATSSFNQTIDFKTNNAREMWMMFGNSNYNRPLNLDTSSLERADEMFNSARFFNSPINFSSTRNVSNFWRMFSNTPVFNQPVTFQTDNATTMEEMFANAASFNQPVNFNTSKVQTMRNMFSGTSAFNQPIDFDGSSLTQADSMFASATSFNKPVVLRNTGLLTSMADMFANAINFNATVNVSSTANVKSMHAMFLNTSGFGQSLAGWDTAAVNNCSDFCEFCGLPSFPRCVPCGQGLPRVVSESKGSVCNCPEAEDCDVDLCTFAQITGSLTVACLRPARPGGQGGGDFVSPPSSSSPSPSSSLILISPLFNITQDGSSSNGTNGSSSDLFVFTLPIDVRVYTEFGKITQPACGPRKLSCEWRDPMTLEFQQSGCAVTRSMVDMGSGVVGTECTCTHLTVFAIALRREEFAPLCHASEVDYVLLGLYGSLSVCVLVQLVRLTVSKLPRASMVQHSLLLAVCALRMAFLIAKPVLSLAVLVLLGLLPSAVSLSLFIYIMLTWASLQLMTLNSSPFARFRVLFVAIATGVFVLVFALTIAVAVTSTSSSSSSSSPSPDANRGGTVVEVVVDGSYVLAALYAVVCGLVFVVGLGLRRNLSHKQGGTGTGTGTGTGSGRSSNTSSSSSNDWRALFRCRVLVTTLGLSSCLLCSACLWVAAVQSDVIVSDAATLAATAAFYVCDWASLCLFVWLLSNAIAAAERKRRRLKLETASSSSTISMQQQQSFSGKLSHVEETINNNTPNQRESSSQW